jgi:hypothetical protein
MLTSTNASNLSFYIPGDKPNILPIKPDLTETRPLPRPIKEDLKFFVVSGSLENSS